jgi:hypothetical protein
VTVHDFRRSLAESAKWIDAPWWSEVYHEAFPTLATMTCVREDTWAQRGGIDRVLTLTDSSVIKVDEKVRTKDYGDVLLEYWSDEERRVPGWVAKDLACDFIAYATVPTRTCLLLPFRLLRRAWRIHHKSWVASYPRVEADNRRYTTVSVAVPTDVLCDAITNAAVVVWSVAEEAA